MFNTKVTHHSNSNHEADTMEFFNSFDEAFAAHSDNFRSIHKIEGEWAEIKKENRNERGIWETQTITIEVM